MKGVIFQNIPLVVACSCLLAGALIGRKAADTNFGAKMVFPALALMIVLLFFDVAIFSWFVGILTGFVDIYAAKLISTGLLSFVCGTLFTIFYNAGKNSKK